MSAHNTHRSDVNISIMYWYATLVLGSQANWKRIKLNVQKNNPIKSSNGSCSVQAVTKLDSTSLIYERAAKKTKIKIHM